MNRGWLWSTARYHAAAGPKACCPVLPAVVWCCLEATMGFEPMIRVLQTLALPLGHVARRSNQPSAISGQLGLVLRGGSGLIAEGGKLIDSQSGRWDSNPRPSPWQGDVLPLNYTRLNDGEDTVIAETCQGSPLSAQVLSRVAGRMNRRLSPSGLRPSGLAGSSAPAECRRSGSAAPPAAPPPSGHSTERSGCLPCCSAPP